MHTGMQGKKTKQVFMNESLNHWLTRFVQMTDSFKKQRKRSKSLWTSHWIIGSLDLFKWLIHSEMKQVTVFMNESLNHWLNSFKQLIHSEMKQETDLYEWVSESCVHLICSKLDLFSNESLLCVDQMHNSSALSWILEIYNCILLHHAVSRPASCS